MLYYHRTDAHSIGAVGLPVGLRRLGASETLHTSQADFFAPILLRFRPIVNTHATRRRAFSK
jgi:hypothetical protein